MLSELENLVHSLRGASWLMGLSSLMIALSTLWFVKRVSFDQMLKLYLVRSSNRATRLRKTRSFCADLLLPIAVAKDLQASLEDVMPIWIREWGLPRARIIRACQVGRVIIGHHLAPMLNLTAKVWKMVSGS